jgi:hypothetical protein
MSSRPFHFTSANNTTPVQVGQLGSAQLTGVSLINTSTTANAAVKFYWGNKLNFSSGNDAPTVGTDIPAYTFSMPAAASATTPVFVTAGWGSSDGPRGNGELWMAITQNAADNDTTAPATGAVIVSLTWQ